MKAVILERYVMHEGDLDWSGVKAIIPTKNDRYVESSCQLC